MDLYTLTSRPMTIQFKVTNNLRTCLLFVAAIFMLFFSQGTCIKDLVDTTANRLDSKPFWSTPCEVINQSNFQVARNGNMSLYYVVLALESRICISYMRQIWTKFYNWYDLNAPERIKYMFKRNEDNPWWIPFYGKNEIPKRLGFKLTEKQLKLPHLSDMHYVLLNSYTMLRRLGNGMEFLIWEHFDKKYPLVDEFQKIAKAICQLMCHLNVIIQERVRREPSKLMYIELVNRDNTIKFYNNTYKWWLQEYAFSQVQNLFEFIFQVFDNHAHSVGIPTHIYDYYHSRKQETYIHEIEP